MGVAWVESTLTPFVVFYAGIYHFWRRGAQRRADFEARSASARRLANFRGWGYVAALLGTLGIAFVTGFGTSLSMFAYDSAAVRRLAPPYVLRLGAIADGPLLAGTLLVHESVAPHLDALYRRTRTRRESMQSFVVAYAVRSVPVFGLLVLIHWVPDGIAAGVTVSVATIAYVALDPYKVRLLGDVREPTPAERSTFEGVEAPSDATVHVLEATDARDVTGMAAGLIPGHRRVFLTDTLVDGLSEREIRAVLAHEYGHLQDHRVFRTTSLKAICLGTAVWAWTGGIRVGLGIGALFDTFFVGAVILAIYLSGVRRLRKNGEFRADRFAAEQVGPGDLARALVRIVDLQDPGVAGAPQQLIVDSEPRVEERIRRLRPELLWSTPPIPTRS